MPLTITTRSLISGRDASETAGRPSKLSFFVDFVRYDVEIGFCCQCRDIFYLVRRQHVSGLDCWES